MSEQELRLKCLEFAISCSSSFKDGENANQKEVVEYASQFFDFVSGTFAIVPRYEAREVNYSQIP
jgi:hypothetical protein